MPLDPRATIAIASASGPDDEAMVERCYAAIRARDPRFDGWFVVGVTSTGIYCRPSCPARTPRRSNVRFLPTAATAQAAGFRACLRCRPDAAPGSPAWDLRADLVGRAMRLIGEGVVEREGVPGLAARLGYSERHLHRQLVAELGAGPLALARARRAQTARILIETTRLPFGEVAFAAGFASIRQFNDTVREVFGRTPTALRDQRRGRRDRPGPTPPDPSSPTPIELRLAYRGPAWLGGVLEHHTQRAIDGVELARAGELVRSLTLPHGAAVVRLTCPADPAARHVQATLWLDDLRDLQVAVTRCRRLLDLDADPVAIDDHLARDPVLAPLVAEVPGTRVPHSPDHWEALVRTVIGQHVSVAGARRFLGRLTAVAGTALAHPAAGLVRAFPTAAAVADADLTGVGLTTARMETLRRLANAVVDGTLVLDVGADRDEARRVLAGVPGLGPWSVEEVALRGLGDPDAFPATDLVLRKAARRLGLPERDRELRARARPWSPWRAYAAQHLWRAELAASRDAA